MNEAAAEVMTLVQRHGWVALLIFLRVGAFVSYAPLFGETFIPSRIKLVIALMLTLVVFSSAPGLIPDTQQDGRLFLRYLVTETICGLVLGLGLRFFAMALQVGASMIAQATSLSQIFGNAGVDPTPAIGHILILAALALSVILGLHIHAVVYLLTSYQVMPPGELPRAGDVAEWGIRLVVECFRLGFSLAAPFLIISLIYNLTLGVINRAMPQLMVAFVGAPVITFGGLALLWMLAPQILSVWSAHILEFVMKPF